MDTFLKMKGLCGDLAFHGFVGAFRFPVAPEGSNIVSDIDMRG
jgi:hypothetical protein